MMIRRKSCIRLLIMAVILVNRPIFAQIVIPAPEPLLEWKATHKNACYDWDASLSIEGRYVVMCDGPKIVVVNTTTKKHKIVHEDPSIASCWTCPQTGGLFVVSMPRVQRQTSGMDLGRGAARLDYLAKPADWFSWNVTWSLPIFYRGIGIQFLDESDHVVILEREPQRLNKKGQPVGSSVATRFSYIRLFDRRKLEAGDNRDLTDRIEVPGLVGGLEWMGENLVVVYASELKGGSDFAIRKAIVDLADGKLTNATNVCTLNQARLSRLPRPAIPNGSSTHVNSGFAFIAPFYENYSPQTVGNRVFRFRGGPKKGDAGRLISRMQVDPTFYMGIDKTGVLDEHMSTLGERTLYSHDRQNRTPFWYLDNSRGATRIADIIPKDGRYKVLTVEAAHPKSRTLRIWDIDPKNP